MPIYIFRSSDTGLPTAGVDAAAGSMTTNVLDPTLVNGYNSRSGVTVTRSGGTATYTFNSHGYAAGSIVTIGGFNETDYNVTGLISNITANTWDMTVANAPATPGTGTGTSIKAPIGWSTTFTGTNIRSYKQKVGSNQFTLGVDDTNASNTRVRMYESMTVAGVAQASGANGTPNDVLFPTGGLYAYKSSAAAATYRNWVLVSNGKIFYLFWQHTGVTTSGQGLAFGDFTTYKYGDAYNTILIANEVASAINTNIRIGTMNTGVNNNTNGHFCMRFHHGSGAGAYLGKGTDSFRSINAIECGSATSSLTYPSPTEGGLLMAPLWLMESQTGWNGIRGHLPGLWCPLHSRPLAHGDTFSGTAGTVLAGKTFEVYNIGSVGQLIFETSDTWS